ncbi:MAG TPA: hypothetical protein VGG56_16955, partial [Terracidiphilus sp.]
REVKARTKETLDQAFTDALPHITPANAMAWFRLPFNSLKKNRNTLEPRKFFQLLTLHPGAAF